MKPPPPSSLGDIVREGLRKSSIRGLPRILGAKSRLMRAVWTATVLVLFGCLTQNIHNLVDSYRRGDTLINTKQWTSQDRQFPTITICNLNPFLVSRSLMAQKGSLTPAEYRDRIIHMTEEANRRGLIDKEEMDLYQDELLNLKAYFDNIDVNLKKFMESYPLILAKSCKIYYRKGNVRKSRKCDSIERRYVLGYINCYSVNVYSASKELVEKVVISTLTHSEDEGVTCSKCIVDNPQSLRQGTIVHLHPRDQYPLFIGEGLYIAPGTQNVIQVKQRKYRLIKDCSNDHPPWLHFYVNDAERSSHYTSELCSTIAKHMAVKRACNCSIDAFPHLTTQEAQTESCYKQNLTEPVINAQFLDCVADVEGRHHQERGDTNGFEEAASLRCPRPCDSEDFSVAHTSTLGATKASALDIYRHYVKGVVNIPRRYRKIYDLALDARDVDKNETLARELMSQTDYLERNFATMVLLHIPNHAKVFTESYLLDSASFVSQLGGAMALFSGITLICVAEVFEVLHDLTAYLCWRCKSGGGSGSASATASAAESAASTAAAAATAGEPTTPATATATVAAMAAAAVLKARISSGRRVRHVPMQSCMLEDL